MPGALYTLANISEDIENDVRGDIREPSTVRDALETTRPDVVIHMAAQPLVRASFENPRTTMETNVLGTLNVLEAVHTSDTVRALVVVTTDKVYRNDGTGTPYRETDPLGGHDPYSASKAMAEILVDSWTKSFPACPTATARAGNVIGGGDVSRDRLLPDLLAAMARGDRPRIRYPDAVRPWQHALDALNGYLTLVQALLDGRVSEPAWNFGPDPASFRTVGEVADRTAELWGGSSGWDRDGAVHPPEAAQLTLDSTLATTGLDWRPRLSFDDALSWTVDWTRSVGEGADARATCVHQVKEFDRRFSD